MCLSHPSFSPSHTLTKSFISIGRPHGTSLSLYREGEREREQEMPEKDGVSSKKEIEEHGGLVCSSSTGPKPFDGRGQKNLPELWRIDNLVFVQGLRHIIGRVELGSANSRYFRNGRLVVHGEGTSILVLNCPQATLVIHLGPAITSHPPHHLLVPAGSQSLHHRDRPREKAIEREDHACAATIPSAMAAKRESETNKPQLCSLYHQTLKTCPTLAGKSHLNGP